MIFFPPTTAEQLHNLTEGLLKLTEKLTLSDTASENLKNTYKGLFAILDICKQAFLATTKLSGPFIKKYSRYERWVSRRDRLYWRMARQA